MKREKKPVSAADFDYDIGTIAICAVRYALGRETYMPGLVQEFVMRHPDMVTESLRSVMILDINEADRICEHKLPNGDILKIDGLGSTTIDRPGWIKFRDWLRELDIKEETK